MPILELENLAKTYKTDGAETPALKGVSFKVEKGEFLAIMGPSGSGKSTLLHLLGFLDEPTSGVYRFAGKTIEDYSEPERAKVRNMKLGFVFQSFNLLHGINVLENVKLPLIYSDIDESEWDGRIKKAIDQVGLAHRLDHLPNQLSGGEQQRVAIARALINNPEMILADEPTGNLDSKSGANVMEALEALNKNGHTIILVTHETYAAESANRIIRLRDGLVESDERVFNRRSANNFFK